MSLPPDEALGQHSDTPVQLESKRPEQGFSGELVPPGRTAAGWEPLPDGLELAPGIDLGLDDPAWVGEPGRPRRCVASRANEDGRCLARAIRTALVCSHHAGRLDSAAGGRARHEKRRLALVQAEERVAERRLGVRAALSAQLQRRIDAVEAAVDHLLTAAAGGDLKSAQALLPWIDQALGKPVVREEHTHSPGALLSQMSGEELAAIVAQGRAQRQRRSA